MSKFTCQPVKYPILRYHGLASKKGAMFGMTRTNPDGSRRAHQGVDLALDKGYKCYAVEDGEVVNVSFSNIGYGNTITIKLNCPHKPDLHGNFAFYAHMSRIDFSVGDKVKAGTVLGLSGDTGNAKGMDTVEEGGHLHFEMRIIAFAGLGLKNRIDPLKFIELVN